MKCSWMRRQRSILYLQKRVLVVYPWPLVSNFMFCFTVRVKT